MLNMKRLLWMGVLLPCLLSSCKDEFTANLEIEKKDAERKIENVSPAKSSSASDDKRKDKDWDLSAGN